MTMACQLGGFLEHDLALSSSQTQLTNFILKILKNIKFKSLMMFKLPVVVALVEVALEHDEVDESCNTAKQLPIDK